MIRFVATLLFCAITSLYFMQESFFSYLEQKYHDDFNLREMSENSWLGSGAKAYKFITNGFNTKSEHENSNEEIAQNIFNSLMPKKVENLDLADINLTHKSQEILRHFKEIQDQKNSIKKQKLAQQNRILEENKNKILALRENAEKSKKADKTDTNETINLAKTTKKDTNGKISLSAGDGVIFVGDSIMEYIARAAKQIFPSKNLQAYDLSKFNTGLLNKKYHDFNKEIKKTIREEGDIKLVVVLLGANDVWSKRIDGKSREFYSEQWINFYKNNIDEIYKTATLGGAQVLWLSLPCMKKQDFNTKIRKLNEIYKEENAKFGGFFVQTDDFICKNGKYISHLTTGNKTIKLRQDDEIHITKSGSMLIAKEILRMIDVN